MTVTAVDVHLDGRDGSVLVGTAYVATRRNATTTTFEYGESYLAWPDSWSVSPDLPMIQRSASTDGLPGAIADSAPDRWGRNLIDKRIRSAARAAGRTPQTATELDYLLGVTDRTRQGALRFTVGDAPTFLADRADVPKLINLPALLDASRQVGFGDDDSAAVKVLLDAGSASLGGARPKASVDHDGRLLIAKFPHDSDTWNVMAWEMTALDLADRCGLETPHHELLPLGSDSVLLLDRFDRDGLRRIPYISAMTLIGARDGSTADYVELAEALADHGSEVKRDLHELWRRIAFSIAINNTDDHLRNHGFLRVNNGWKLAPLFDVNPNPDRRAERVTSIYGTTTPDDAFDALMGAIESFDLSSDDAAATWAEVLDGVSDWEQIAARHGISAAERRDFTPVLARG